MHFCHSNSSSTFKEGYNLSEDPYRTTEIAWILTPKLEVFPPRASPEINSELRKKNYRIGQRNKAQIQISLFDYHQVSVNNFNASKLVKEPSILDRLTNQNEENLKLLDDFESFK